MKCNSVIILLMLSGVTMSSTANSENDNYRIRTLFNIKKSFCAIRTNGVLGMDNRDSAYEGRGSGISSTNSLLFLENGENNISLEIGSLGWFSRKDLTDTERNKFDSNSSCRLEIVKSQGNKRETFSVVNVVVNNHGIPESLENDSSETGGDIEFTKTVSEEVISGHIDPKYFWDRYFPQGMELYKFTVHLNIRDLPEWKWVKANAFTGSNEQILELRQAYLDISHAINNHDRKALKNLYKTSLEAWSITTGETEDNILESQYTKEEIELGGAIINPINWNDYSIRVMNKGRMVQFYNKSETTYSPLSFYVINANGKKSLYSYAPIFSMINGKFAVVI